MSTEQFTTRLKAQQQAALDGMRSTTGADFTKHCDAFMDVTAALRVLWDFEVEASNG